MAKKRKLVNLDLDVYEWLKLKAEPGFHDTPNKVLTRMMNAEGHWKVTKTRKKFILNEEATNG